MRFLKPCIIVSFNLFQSPGWSLKNNHLRTLNNQRITHEGNSIPFDLCDQLNTIPHNNLKF